MPHARQELLDGIVEERSYQLKTSMTVMTD